MYGIGNKSLAIAVALVVPTVGGCILDTVDLRYRLPDQSPPTCDAGLRYDSASRACVACTVMSPPSGECLCDWEYRPAELPYCEGLEAYYVCQPCQDSIRACNDLTPSTTGVGLGSTFDCDRIHACCADLAGEHPRRAECCACGATLVCEPDTTDPEGARFMVRCDPEPGCHGAACPNGVTDCLGFQTCDAGVCTPACNPVTETCSLEAGCMCEAVPP
jgi:hypothetical protein